jgi:tellurite resistance protein TerC
LTVIVGTLAVTTVASLAVSRKRTLQQQDAETGPRRDWENG